MTRKHYVMLAAVLASIDPSEFDNPNTARSVQRAIASRMADALANDNARFDRGRFMRAARPTIDSGDEPHCDQHAGFDIDCLECSDALDRARAQV